MKEFLYKNSFIRFYTALLGQRITYKQNGLAPLIFFSVLMFFGMLFAMPFYINNLIQLICFVAFFFFILCQSFGLRINSVPNMGCVIPISHRKKSVWYMLSSLFTVIIALIVFFLVLLVFYGITCVIKIANGVMCGPFFWFDDANVFKDVGLYGGIFSAIYIVICYSVGTIAGLTKKKLYKYLSLTAFVILNFLTFVLVNTLSPVEDLRSVFYLYSCSPFTNKSYELMPNLWVILLVYGIVAAGLLGYTIYAVLKRFSPNKY